MPRTESRAALLSIVVGVALLGVKFGAYFLTGSAAIFADAMEGIVNIAASAFALYALVLAHSPPDPEHPYGHGKIEFFSAGLEGGMILLAAVISAGKGADVLLRGQHLQGGRLGFGLALMGVALVANGLVGGYLIVAGKRSSSMVLEADGWHLVGDAITSTAAMAALVLVQLTGFTKADPLMAIAVALYIAWTGIRLIRRSAGGLMDEQDAADSATIRQVLDTHVGPAAADPQICSYHKLRHRHSGRFHWVDFHIMIPGHWDIDAGHRAASALEYEIEQALTEGNATAHVEPCPDDGVNGHVCAHRPRVGPPPSPELREAKQDRVPH